MAVYGNTGTISPITIENPNLSRRHQVCVFTSKGAVVFNINENWTSVIGQSDSTINMEIGDNYTFSISGLDWYQMCILFVLN